MGKHEIAKQSAVTQDKALRLAVAVFGVLSTITILASIAATNIRINVSATSATTSANASVNVSAACTLSGGATYVDNIPNNSSKTFGPGTLRATCNDPDGYSIYAIGYSNDTYGNTSMVSTVDPDSPTNIPTNTTGSNSWWAMQLSATGATIQNNFDSLHAIPDTYTKVATKTSVSAGTTGESTVNSNYTVSISSTQAAGTYTGKVKYTLVHPNNAPTPSPSMQDFTLAQCQAKASDADYTLMDDRDGKKYTVRYLDGNCWMTQNLAIEPGTHMTEADTNITSAQYNHDGYYALPGEGYDLRTDGTAASETSTGNCNRANNAGYINACTHMADSQDIQDIRNADTEGVLDYTNTYTISNIGAWYNYAAATAGSIAIASTTDEDVYNICPQGWTLPSHAQNSALVTALSADNTVFNPLYGGLYNNGLHTGPATLGNWWSTTAYNGTYRWTLGYTSGSLSTSRILRYRYYGFYVRCIMVAS